jgi:hypothetical protein
MGGMSKLRLITAVALVAFAVNIWTLSLYKLLFSPEITAESLRQVIFSQVREIRAGIGGTPVGGIGELSFTELDTILERLQLGNIVFNAPVTLQRGRWDVIQLVLSYKDSINKLENLITAAGEKITARVQISDRMEATLYGSAFDIKAVTPSIQAVSKIVTTQWKWEIKPTESGLQRLYLTLYAILFIDGKQTPRSIHTYEKSIDVYVPWPQKLSDFASNNWQWLWTAILIPLAGRLLPKQKKAEAPDVC